MLSGCASSEVSRSTDAVVVNHGLGLRCCAYLEKNHKRSICYQIFYTGKGLMLVHKLPSLSFEREGVIEKSGLRESFLAMYFWPDPETAFLNRRPEYVALPRLKDEKALDRPRVGGEVPLELYISVDLNEDQSAQFDKEGKIIGLGSIRFIELLTQNGTQKWISGEAELRADCKRYDLKHKEGSRASNAIR
jgi:hypothetical protein